MRQGQAAIQSKNLAEAIYCFEKAVAESPKDAQAKACLGQALCWEGRRDEGLAMLRQSGQLLLKKARKTRDIRLPVDLADQLQYWNDYAGSAELCKQAVQIDPRYVRGFQLLALSYMRLNQKKPALSAAKQALKLVPESTMLPILVATMEIADNQNESARQRLEKVLRDPSIKPEEKFRAHKELARVLDKLGVYEAVFAHLHAAADVSPRLPEVRQQNRAMVPEMLESNKTGFDSELLGRWSSGQFPVDQPAPVFVLGFMRTGTTLTQEVLGAHPKVFVADETDLVMATVKELARLSGGKGTVPEQLRALDWAGVLQLRRFYWDRARALFGDAIGNRLLLDKTTMNTIDLGLINCIFPDAKLVFLLRDPRDVCLSCFMQTMIPSPSTVHLFTWLDTARFYAEVMDWWLTVRPKLTMGYTELRYEDAVTDFEVTFQQVFAFLGLDWDPVVADFHQKAARKFIASPSFGQVSQPLYTSSVSRWRHYADEYSAVSDTLMPYIREFGYG